jgi:glutathione S-transferase
VTEALATVTVERVLDAPPADVYDAWVEPAVLAGFIAPAPGTAEVEIDPRVGGRMRIVMTFPDRVTEIEGEYLVLDRPHRIAFSWRPLRAGFESVVTVALEPHGAASTRMTITHTRLPEPWTGSYERGWGSIAGALGRRVRR